MNRWQRNRDMIGAKRSVARFVGGGLLMITVGCGGTAEPTEGQPVANYEGLKLEISGGYGPAPCSNGVDRYEMTRVPGHLAWSGCDYGKTPAESVMGDRLLSADEVEAVTRAFSTVQASSAKTCGADAALLTLDVSTSSGIESYVDDFYSGCPWEAHSGRRFVVNLGNLSAALSRLAKP